MSSKSFSFKAEFTDEERSASSHKSSGIQDFGDVKEATVAYEESSNVEAVIGDPLNIKEEAEDVVEAMEGITVGEVFHVVESSLDTICNWQDVGKINKDVQVNIPKLKMGQKLSLNIREGIFVCHVKLKMKFKNKLSLERHIESVHLKVKPHQCQCLKKFSSMKSLNRHNKHCQRHNGPRN